MIKITQLIWSALVLFTLALFIPTSLEAAAEERVVRFDSVVEVREEGVLRVTENIVYDFDENERRGIFRTIPRIYRSDGDRYRMGVTNINVVDESGKNYITDISFSRSDYRIRIGDPDQTVSGKHTYILSYDVSGAISPLGDFDEVYWNATGNDWEVEIESATLRVILPTVVEGQDSLAVSCYQGELGSSEGCVERNIFTEGDKTVVEFSSTSIDPGSGLTGAVGFPKGVVLEAERELASLSAEIVRLIYIVLGVVTAGFLAWAIQHWRKNGRGYKGSGVIVTQYDPPADMSPAEVGFVIDQKIDNRDITAEIVFLAERGLIHIMAVPKDGFMARGSTYYLLKMRRDDSSLSEHQRSLFQAMFSGGRIFSSLETDKLASDIEGNKKIQSDKGELLKKINESLALTSLDELSKPTTTKSFYEDLQEVREIIEDRSVEHRLFVKKPSDIKTRYGIMTGIGAALILLTIIVSAVLGEVTIVPAGVLLGGVVLGTGILFMNIMVKRTEKGVAAQEHVLGLKEYLTIAEKDRLEFHFNPKNNPELFERLLPFAIALGVEKQWARELDDIHIDPSWYSDASMNAFTIGAFSNSFSQFNATPVSGYGAMSGAASVGGGFSGGGAGGGGGGSW